jgi:6-pyruvoyl-tetrahydropterin synthase
MDAFGIRQWIATRREPPARMVNAPPPTGGPRVEITQRLRFEAAHRLPDQTGHQAITHGHSWLVDVTVAGIQDDGAMLDGQLLSQHFRMHLAPLLDHADLNTTLPDDCQPPTGANVALYIMGSYLDHGFHVIRVSVHEGGLAATILA